MSDNAKNLSHPNWKGLFEVATTQEGHFTTSQAADAGYSPQLLNKYIKSGRIKRIRRGIYRIVHFPASEHEDLVVVWLWTERVGVFSHETSLALFELSDVMPLKTHITLPGSWTGRRLRVPKDVVMHFADIPDVDQTWFGPVPVTTIERTLIDCADDKVKPEFIRDAFEEAAERGLIDRNSLPDVISYLKHFYDVSHGRSGPQFHSNLVRMPGSVN